MLKYIQNIYIYYFIGFPLAFAAAAGFSNESAIIKANIINKIEMYVFFILIPRNAFISRFALTNYKCNFIENAKKFNKYIEEKEK